jgi:hypothetical protein
VADVRRWWQERIAAFHQWPADRRERARMNAAIAAEREAAQTALAMAAERELKPAPKIMSLDGRAPILELNQRLRVQTDRSRRAGVLVDITEGGLKVSWDFPANSEIPWDQVRQISVRRGRARQWAVPVGLAILGAGFLGACGWLYSEFDHSTSGRAQDPSAPLWGTLIGGLIAGAFGMIIMYALPGPRWRKLVDVPTGTATLTLSTFAARAADTAAAISSAADSEWVSEDSVEAIARVLLLTILLAMFSTCASHLHE